MQIPLLVTEVSQFRILQLSLDYATSARSFMGDSTVVVLQNYEHIAILSPDSPQLSAIATLI